MNHKIKSVDEIIRKRAEARLDADIQEFVDLVHQRNNDRHGGTYGESLLMKYTDDIEIIPPENKEKRLSLRSALWSPGNTIWKHIRERALPDYIDDETHRFVNDLEDVKAQNDELRSRIEEIQGDINFE